MFQIFRNGCANSLAFLGRIARAVRSRLVVNVLSAIAATLVRPLVSIVTLPALSAAIGQALLGFWLIALSISILLSALNTGLSAALLSSLGREEKTEDVIFHGLILSLVFSFFCVVIGAVGILTLDAHSLLNLPDTVPGSSVVGTLLTLLGGLVIGFPASVGKWAAIGLGKGYKAQGIDIVATLAGAAALLLLIQIGAGIVAFAATVLMLPALVSLFLSRGYLLSCGPVNSGRINRQLLLKMIRNASTMALHQLLLAANQHADVLIVGAILGLREAAVYGVGQRLWSLANAVVTPINHSLWPDLNALDAQNNLKRLRSFFGLQFLLTMVLCAVFVLCIVTAGNSIITIWVGPKYVLEQNLIYSFAFSTSVYVISNTTEMLLRARKRFDILMWLTMFAVPLALCTRYFVGLMFGASGVAWGGAAVMLFCVALPSLGFSVYWLRRPASVGSDGSR